MTTPASSSLPSVEGLYYHERTKALHLRLDKREVLPGIVTAIQHGNQLGKSESLHLLLADTLFQPEQANTRTYEESFEELCRAIGDTLVDLNEIHIGRALCGFINTNLGAWCPVEGIQLLLSRSTTKLESLMLRNLQVYSARQRAGAAAEQQQQQQQATATYPVHLLAESLQGHASLQQFGWQHSEFIPRSVPTLDPMLQSLASVSGLRNMVIQSPPWAMMRVPTSHQVLKGLIQPNLRALHLEGLHLQDRHIENLLGPQKHATTLQTLSLSLQLTLVNIQSLASCLALFLRHSTDSLLHMGLRLEWLVEDGRMVTSKSYRQQRLVALEAFQATLAGAIGGVGQVCWLQRLDLIYYDSSHRWGECPTTRLHQPNPFRHVLEDTNYSLTHLRLPFCGEMDPAIDFLLKLNRTGWRQRLLRQQQDGGVSREECLQGLVRVQTPAKNYVPASCAANTGLSMVFYLLRELPILFV